jgi:predicted acyltransferase
VQGLLRWQDGMAANGQPRWTTPMDWAAQHLFAPLAADPRIGSLLFALANLAGYWLLAWWLDRRRIYLKV